MGRWGDGVRVCGSVSEGIKGDTPANVCLCWVYPFAALLVSRNAGLWTVVDFFLLFDSLPACVYAEFLFDL